MQYAEGRRQKAEDRKQSTECALNHVRFRALALNPLRFRALAISPPWFRAAMHPMWCMAESNKEN
jgi:hypothetical protein